MLFLIIERLNCLYFSGCVAALLFGIPLLWASFVVPQWFVLRRQVTRAGWWVVASTVGLVVAGAGVLASIQYFLDAFLSEIKPGFGPGDAAVGLILSLAIYGAITGAVLVWLLRQPRPEAWS
jgi:hypothetical protein